MVATPVVLLGKLYFVVYFSDPPTKIEEDNDVHLHVSL